MLDHRKPEQRMHKSISKRVGLSGGAWGMVGGQHIPVETR